MNFIKNVLAALIGLLLATVLLISADIAVGIYNEPQFVINQESQLTTRPPDFALAKNPDPNVPEDFIISYPGILDVNWGNNVEERSDYELWNKFDDDLGTTNGNNVVIRHQMRKGKQFIYNVTYKTDQFGRRITQVLHPEKKKKFIAFFGCSFVWGSCINENETLPYYVGQLAPNYLPYNYGRGASGTNYLLALMQTKKLVKEITPSEGVGVYVFIGDHVGRSIGDVFNTASMYFMPYYEKIDGKLVRNGSFLSGRPLTTSLYRGLYKTHFFSRLNIEWPQIDSGHIEFVCDMITESKNEFLKQFPTSKFVVMFHPLQRPHASELIPCLESRSITYLDYNFYWLDENYRVPIDNHPNARANKELAEVLVRDLHLND